MSSVLPGPAEMTPVPAREAATVASGESGWRRAIGFVRAHLWLVLLLLAAVIVAAAAGPRIVLGPEVPVELIERHDLVQSVVASGRIEAPHRIDVGVQITGTVVRVPVSEGQVVSAGATLFELESSELRAAQSQAEFAVAIAVAKARQLREVQSPNAVQAVRQARLALDAAQAARMRSDALLVGGAIGEAARDDALRTEQTAAAQLRVAEQQAASAAPSGSDAAVAAAAVAQAKAAVQLASARLSYATVRAAKAGTLITRNVEAGDVVQPGRVLMMLSPGGDTEIIVQIDEKNLQSLRLGQMALVSADAFPKLRFAATVAYINPGIDATRGAVEIKLRVASPPAYLRQDMTASVDIEVARRDSAILVPTGAVHDLETAAPWVYRIDGRRARRQPVTIGLRSGGLCEVLAGLAPGDRVVSASDLTVRDGARVRGVLPVLPK